MNDNNNKPGLFFEQCHRGIRLSLILCLNPEALEKEVMTMPYY